MAEGLWEQAVETYLTINRGVFLNPQYLVGQPNVWTSDIDFLAIDFPKRKIWMVEVTKSPSAKLFNKISRFEEDYRPRIQDQLERHRVVPETNPWEEWCLGLWIFAPKDTRGGIEVRLRVVPSRQFTSLEETIFPPWDKLFI